MNLSIIGTKGSGKGTQINKLLDNFNLVYFSPGDMFREAAHKRTSLGLIAERVINSGELVADATVNGMVQEWLWTTSPNQSIVFDGFPRTLDQADFLDQALTDMKRILDAVIYLEVADKTVIERLSGRRFCRQCRDEFHLVSSPFERCPYQKCEGQFLQPFDEDKPEIILTLVNRFRQGVRPLLSFYKKRGKLIQVNGEGDTEMVHDRLVKAILPFR